MCENPKDHSGPHCFVKETIGIAPQKEPSLLGEDSCLSYGFQEECMALGLKVPGNQFLGATQVIGTNGDH